MPRYAIEKHPNEARISIHVDVPVPQFSWYDREQISADAAELKKALESINGVVEASTHKQKFSIERGGAFTWDELVPKVLTVLQDHLPGFATPEEVSAYR